jgi:hypothetical protein
MGHIRREDGTEGNWGPLNIKNKYIRIRTQYEGAAPQPIWIGIVTDETRTFDNASTPSGTQSITAREISYLLDRQAINKAYTDQLMSGTIEEIDYCPKFNLSTEKGNTIEGNRTGFPSDGAYHFSTDSLFGKEKWTYKNIIEYLLVFFAPQNVTVQITGQTSALDSITEVVDVEGLTLWQAINRLVDRKRGMSLFVNVKANGTVELRINSITEFSIQTGALTLPANNNQTSFSTPTQYPFSHMVDDIEFATCATQQYTKIIVQGARVLVCGTWAFHDSTLTYGWSLTREDEYIHASNTDDVEANDLFRAADKYESVFTHFRVPKNWDGKLGNGQSNPKNNAVPVALDNGTVKMADAENPQFWIGDKVFERELPLREQTDYSIGSEPGDLNPLLDDKEFQPLIVIIKDIDNLGEPTHEPDGKYHLIEKLHQTNQELKDIGSVTPLDKTMGVKLSVNPNHYLALGYWGAAEPSTDTAELNWEELIVTAAYKSDARQRIVLYGQPQSETENVLTITLDHAQYWVADKQTVVGVTTTGSLQHISEEAPMWILRNDLTKLQATASLCSAWYGRQRQACTIPIKQIGVYVSLGALLTSITSAYNSEQIYTVVTGRKIDYQGSTTSIVTGYSDLDFERIGGK